MGVFLNSALSIILHADFVEDLRVMASGLIYKLILTIATVIYDVASAVFQVFLLLANGMVIESDKYVTVLHNFYIILGVIILFVLSFVLLRAMVNPDDQSKGASSVRKIILNLITSAIIIALLPTVFNFMFDVQQSFIGNNVIGKIFNYGGNESDTGEDIKTGSYKIVNGVFTAFFNADPDYCESSTKEGIETCQSSIISEDGYNFNGEGINSHDLLSTINAVDRTGKFSYYKAFAKNVANDEIHFNFILILIAGCLLVYVGASFCFDMALRLVKLVFYQIIAPIPIFMRVVPDGKFSGTFNTWLKITLACYFEVFIRILVLYLSIWLCTFVLDPSNTFFNVTIYSPGFFVGSLAKAFVLMGIIMFMRQAPKLVSEVTGFDTGNMKLGIREKLAAGGAFTAGALIGGGITAGARGLVGSYSETFKGSGIAEEWKNGNKFRAAGRALKYGIKGMPSAGVSFVTGGTSGAIRSGWAAKGAKNEKDMVKAAGIGAKAAVDAKDKRAGYKARHGGTFEGVMKGHASDTWDTVKRWAGVNNIQALNEEKAAINKVTSSVDAVTDATKNMLKSEINGKGKGWTFGLDANSPEGIGDVNDARYGGKFGYAFTPENYRTFSDALDRAKNTGGEVNFNGKNYNADELQRMFGKYESDYSKALANKLFVSDEEYNNTILKDIEKKYTVNGVLDKAKYLDEVALMNSQRSIATAAKNELNRALGSGLIEIANEQAFEIEHNRPNETDEAKRERLISENKILDNKTVYGSIKVNDSGAIDRLGAAAKQRLGEIDAEVSKIQQREKDKEGK